MGDFFSSFSPARCADARAKSISPNTGKGYQRSPTRRTHPEDVYPELEPQVGKLSKVFGSSLVLEPL